MPEITLEDVKRLHLEPGDQLLVRVPRTIPRTAIEFVIEQLRPQFGDRVLVTTDDVDLTVLRADPGLLNAAVEASIADLSRRASMAPRFHA